MSTTNNQPDDPQAHGREPEPHTPDQSPAERPQARDTLGWTKTGLSAAFCTTGVVLSLTGHEAVGVALISAGSLGGGIQINLPGRK
ncbi:hypothetical protein [Streptomyces natalensis]|uniref:Uncharacterized protein n=1 Tax=Streptomyces natalensis ATCC 27448 TaxID=1240678 RepID=A0A0D7CJM8_9ACTN|nr:hypothetical protein [Streptomyces natalensis]KIZ15637.1 hypothetical protein SNA_25800 [Streptomyces natalensis ATCC 27448]